MVMVVSWLRVIGLLYSLVLSLTNTAETSGIRDGHDGFPFTLLRAQPRVEVRRGRSVYLRPNDLFADVRQLPEEYGCRVRVKPNEPVSAMSGDLHPQLFECKFADDRVKYTHNGSPFTNDDDVLLQMFILSPENATQKVTFQLHIDVIDWSYDVIVTSQKQLEVDMETAQTSPIDSSVLMFHFGYSYDTYCSVSLSQDTWPRLGRLIRGLTQEPIREFHENCRDILHKGYRYEYFGNLSQHNMDYIPLKVSYYNGIGAGNVTEENYFLPVYIPIPSSYKNPKDINVSLTLPLTEYETTIMEGALVQNIDKNNRYGYVMYEIISPTKSSLYSSGYFVHSSDPTTSITSFSHQDLINGRIGFNPRIRNKVETLFTYESIVFTIAAYDAFLQTSQNISLNTILHNEELILHEPITIAESVIVNEGSSAVISRTHFIFPVTTSLNEVEFSVKAGLKHGEIHVNGTKATVFDFWQLASGLVNYVHDGSRAPDDRISLRVSDGRGTLKVRLPVLILPRDDSTPQIVTNRELIVKFAEYARITHNHLSAKDRDSPALDIVYNIKMVPRLGVIEKAYHSLSRGVAVSQFTQDDIDNGYIFYHHTSPHSLDIDTYDTFEFRLSDSVPNKSGSHIMGVKVVPRIGKPPEPSGTLELTSRETDITYITQEMLNYISDKSPGQITYTILSQPFFAKSTMTVNAGRVIASRNMSIPVTDITQDLPAIWSFTQEDVNTDQVAYLPPLGDTGPVRREAQFMFSVTDLYENTIMDQQFDISILPVNNRAPQIYVGDITVKEGETVTITIEQLNARDQDTEPERLTLTVKQVPKYGRLLLGEQPLVLGEMFALADIQSNSLQYRHDGTETAEDACVLLLSDGVNSITTRVPVYIELLGYPGYDEALPNDEADIYLVEKYAQRENQVLTVDKGKNTWHEINLQEKEESSKYGTEEDRNSEVTSQEITLTSEERLGSTMATGTSDPWRQRSTERETVRDPVTSNEPTTEREIPTSVQPTQEQTEIMEFLQTKNLSVPEMGEAAISIENLDLTPEQGSDLDTRLSFLPPNLGHILLNGLQAVEFTLEDVRYGRVVYKHKGGEIGFDHLYDTVTIRVISNGLDSKFNAPIVKMNVTIMPIDNQRPVIMLGEKIYVQEGEAIGLGLEQLSPQDVDTRMEDLVFHIARQPQWGFIENMRLYSLSGNSYGRQVESFTYTDLKNGYINYVQANHTGVEPVDDILDIYTFDGTQYSLPAQININILPINDEMPQFDLEEIVIEEGSSKILSSEFVKAYDGDRPEQRLVLSLTSKPRHGELVILYMTQPDAGQGFEIPMNDVTMNDLEQGRMKLVYKHDGSENFKDSFVLQLTDGIYVARRTASVTVIPKNDELPELLHNSVLSVNFGETVLINNSVLMTLDKDNTDEEVRYILLSQPRKGMLQKKDNQTTSASYASIFGMEDIKWLEISTGNSFSQKDINGNLIRYVHTGAGSDVRREVNSGNFDKFVFQLSDGVNTLPPVSFDVDIIASDSMHIALLNRGFKVQEGDTKVITTTFLSASDGTNHPEQLLFHVTTPPRYGQLSLVDFNDSAISSFTQDDLESNRVMYAHTSKRDSHEDVIRFTVVNAQNHSRIAIFKIMIVPIDRILPSLDRNVPLTVIQDEAVTLTPANLHISDPDTPPSNLTYVIVEPPHFGVLLLSGSAVSQFTQWEVDEGLIQYKNAGSNHAGVDYFLFTISDGHNSGFRVNGTREAKPAFFNFLVQPPEKKPPEIIHVKPPTSLEALGNGNFGFIFTSENLKAVHPKSSSEDVVYTIVDRPQHGILQNLREFRMIRKKFSQKDVDEGNVAFLLDDDQQATADNFTFEVSDAISQSSLSELTYDMQWSVVEFAHSLHIVCEDAGYLLVVLERKGATDGTAFVEYKQKSMSAKSNLDYRLLTSAKRVDFEPGARFAAIYIQIVNDGMPEENEKFRLKLKKANNAVIGTMDKTVVQIINLNDEGVCEEYIGMITRDDRDPLGFGYDAMFPGRTFPPEPTTTTPAPTTTRFDVFEYGLQLYEDSDSDEDEDGDDYLDVADIELLPPKQLLPNFGKENARPGKESAVVGRHGYSLLPTPGSTVAPQSCTAHIKNLLYFDMKTAKVYKCDGEVWVRWGWGAGYALNDAGHEEDAVRDQQQSNVPLQEKTCPDDWTGYEDSCYRLLLERQTWEEAEEECRRLGGNLAEVTSQDHLEWLWALTEKERFWIGLYSMRPDGDWLYTSGLKSDYNHWKPGYPRIDNTHRYNVRECVLVIGKMWWVNRPCNRSRASFVCSKSLQNSESQAQSYSRWYP